jgi:hypothetical protein
MHRLTLAFSLLALLALTAGAQDDLYRAGQKALDAHRWGEAAELFGQAAERGGAQADAALYWRAYAQGKRGKDADALATLRRLRERHPKSAWLDDAEALEVEIRGPRAGAAPETVGDEELKLYAINGLMGADPERAVPLLLKFLRGNHSPKLEEQALFVLSQAEAPEARQVLVDTARGAANPGLQRKAIEYLGVAGDRASVEALRGIYRDATEPAIKMEVLEAFLVADAPGPVVEAARGERDPRLRRKAIELLGAMDAKGELRQLYQGELPPDLKLEVLEALAVAGDVETLAGVARQEQDPRLRRQAIQGLGISEGPASAAALKAIYAAHADRETRSAVIDALFVQDNAQALIEIFRSEKDPALKREAVQKLTLIDSPEANRFLDSVLDND